jgi:hypothetical protein
MRRSAAFLAPGRRFPKSGDDSMSLVNPSNYINYSEHSPEEYEEFIEDEDSADGHEEDDDDMGEGRSGGSRLENKNGGFFILFLLV